MNSSVVYRNKKTSRNEAEDGCSKKSLYFMARPKSWNEFQSNLSSFKSIRRPINAGEVVDSCSKQGRIVTAAEPSEMNTCYPDVVYRKKTNNQSSGSTARRPRPVSEKLVPTPLFKSVTLLKQEKQQTSNTESIKNATKESKAIDKRQQSKDPQVLKSTNALENKPSTTTADLPLFSSFPHVKLSGFKRTNVAYSTHAQRDLDNSNLSQKSTPTRSTEFESTKIASSGLEPHATNANKKSENTTPKPIDSCVSVFSNYTKGLKAEHDSDECNSTNESDSSDSSNESSVIDTGFSSFGDLGTSLVSNDISDSSLNHEDDNRKREKENPSPTPAIPTTLESCYLNTCEIRSDVEKTSSLTSRSSTTSLSEIPSEVENATDTISVNSIQNSSGSSASYFLPDSKDANAAGSQAKQVSTANVFVANARNLEATNRDALFERDRSTDDKTSRELSTTKSWKDDGNSLALSSCVAVDESAPSPAHGTWPRRVHRSKQKQSRVEADELLRRFRETTESYRTRFQNIYDESRRRIEQTMFGLRVALAKNGYKSKYTILQKSSSISNSGAA